MYKGNASGLSFYRYSNNMVSIRLYSQNANYGKKIDIYETGYYVGEFKNNDIYGKGIFYFNNRSVYNGYFDEHIKQSGFAKTLYSDGTIYIGEHSNGTRHGQGIFYKLDGSVIKELLNNDCSKDSLEDLLNQLDQMIGLDKVKQEVKNRVNMIKVKKIRESQGLKVPPISLHLVFSGNSGTGKTTVARLLAHIYKELGVLSKGHIVEVDRGGLVGQYIGHTESKVKDVVDLAMGGILFIDEAYSLTVGKKEDDFGYIAVDTLLKLMEDHRDNLVVIVAGYSDKMKEFIYHSNQGLSSRFNTFIEFEDYNPKELKMIFDSLCEQNDYYANNEAVSYLWDYFYQLYKNKDESFANGRLVRNIFEKIIVHQTNRVVTLINPSQEDIMSITLDDVKNSL